METGWNLGPFAAVLNCLHLDKHLLKQQNRNKLYGTTKNVAQLGQILDKIYRDHKPQLSLLKSPEQIQSMTHAHNPI